MMGGFVSLSRSNSVARMSPDGAFPDRSQPLRANPSLPSSPIIAFAAWHSLAWLVFANLVGVLIASLLLLPSLNHLLQPWTYGRWMPVHINLQLYGWCSLPLVAFLFKVYGADRNPTASWCRPILWVWSSALAVGALSWVTGHSSGKLFLDWTGYSRILFPLALLALWSLLAFAFARDWNAGRSSISIKLVKLAGLVLLFAVPILIYVAASPNLYPPINPDTGGPTGASQLESTLIVIAILLLLPFGLTHRKTTNSWPVYLPWCIFAAEVLLCLVLGRADVSHHRPTQYISLGSLLVWLPLTPMYYNAFSWHENTRRWRLAFLCWWSILVPTGWCLFLPGVLDHFKFTDGLVGHSLLAMAGFVTSLIIFVMVQLLGDDGWIFNGTWSFYVWQLSVVAYVSLMFLAGWHEGSDPAFALVPGPLRNAIYISRLFLGIMLFIASIDWLRDATHLLRERPTRLHHALQDRSA
jgi:cytochrome c oxidase cbb3-type subunit 1